MNKLWLGFFLCVLSLSALSFSVRAEEKESVYDRVMRTGVIRCGWNTEPPMLEVDPNTGKVFGAIPDIVEHMANLFSLKVEWAEQVGWSEMTAGLLSDRYDLICNGKWVYAPQARGGQFSPPLYYLAVHAYGRADETRIKDDLSNLNSEEFTLTSMDGEINYNLAYENFPKTKKVEFSSLTSKAELILAVVNKKADVTFMPTFTALDYMAEHPGKIKQITKEPIASFDTALMFKIGEYKFAAMLDAAIRQMHSFGTIDKILDRYNVDKEQTLRVAKPYESP